MFLSLILLTRCLNGKIKLRALLNLGVRTNFIVLIYSQGSVTKVGRSKKVQFFITMTGTTN